MSKLFKPKIAKQQAWPKVGDRVVRIQEVEDTAEVVNGSTTIQHGNVCADLILKDKFQFIPEGTKGTITYIDEEQIKVAWGGYEGEWSYLRPYARHQIGLVRK